MLSQLVKHPKPTGDGYCPPEVLCAHEIEDKINERACTRDLNDSDFADTGITSDSGGSDEDNDKPIASSHPSKFHTASCRDDDNNADPKFRPHKIRATVRRPDPSQT